MSSKEPKYPLSIRLTEPVVFLRGAPDVSGGRRRHDVGDTPPALLRGLLTLHLAKRTRVSSIELELEGKTTIQWPEGAGPRRVDIPEEHKILSARTVFFSAKACPTSTRSASLGPATRVLDDESDERTNESRPGTARSSSHFRQEFPSDFAGDSAQRSSSLAAPLRRNSADHYGWQQSAAGPNTAATLLGSQPPTPPASPPYTPEPVFSPLFSEMPISRPQTPLEPRLDGQNPFPKGFRTEENPGQMLEEYRKALRMEMGSSTRPTASRTPSDPSPQNSESALAAGSSASSLLLTPDRPTRSESAPGSRSTSRSVSRDVAYRETRHTSPQASMHIRTASNPSLVPLRTPRLPLLNDPDIEQGTRGRHSTRWSLSNMSSVLKDVKDKVRNGSVERRPGKSLERMGIPPRVDFAVGSEEREGRRLEKGSKSALGKLTAAVWQDEAPNVDGWKEFRAGTYTYPISFSIPADTPPTLHCDYGAVVYRLKAVVHRPGALTTKLAVSTEVALVACPPDDGSEDTHSIIVERQWDAQLRYLIALNGRSFPIGSQVPFSLTMVPMEKCKVYRLSVFLEEKTEYFGRTKNTVREQPIKRFELLSIRHPEKNAPPILPLSPEHASLFMPYIDTSSSSIPSSPDEALSSLMGPGPWAIHHELQIPAQCGRIRFTYKHKGAQISVHHILKIVFRVERGDDMAVDAKTGKRRLFDIVVQTPIQILSCHCNPEQTVLPRYSLFAAGTTGAGVDGMPLRSCTCSGYSPPIPGTRTFATPTPTPANSRPSTADAHAQSSADAERANDSYQFARLVSGQESERGEAPPEYTEVLQER